MKPISSQLIVRTALLLAVLAGLALAPGGAVAANTLLAETLAAPDGNLVVMLMGPLVRVYEGDTITIPYMVEDLSPGGLALAPLTPGTAAATASLGQVSADPSGMTGSLTYTAEKHGDEQIELAISNAIGSGTGSLDLKVYPRPNYDLNFIAVSEASDAAGGAFRAIFSGQGKFANIEDAPISGQGNADYWFALWVTNPNFVCSMKPPVQGSTGFNISGMSGPAALVPGSIDPMIIDLEFPGEVSLNASNIDCSGLGGVTASFPWPAASGAAGGYPLTGLYFPGEGGVVEISAPKTWGFVTVTRIEP